MKNDPSALALADLEEALDSDFLKALGEPTRVQILRLLIPQGPLDVGEISEQLPQERSVISRHLKVMMHAGLVRVERDGRRRVYHLVPEVFVGKIERLLGSVKVCMASCCN